MTTDEHLENAARECAEKLCYGKAPVNLSTIEVVKNIILQFARTITAGLVKERDECARVLMLANEWIKDAKPLLEKGGQMERECLALRATVQRQEEDSDEDLSPVLSIFPIGTREEMIEYGKQTALNGSPASMQQDKPDKE